jgi:7,8-dihydropterin-6-yl-methyl-4-(beta-D-ribofuranosyl)aminobenzene 5'-phosphate synthase
MNIKIIASGSTKIEYMRKKWGLSVLIGEDVLFDTFCSAVLLKAHFEKYGVDTGSIKHIVISHEHWDHTGGLWWILEHNNNIKVYVCSRFSDEFKQKIKEYGGTLVEVKQSMSIKENIFTTGEIEANYNNRPIFEQSLMCKQKNKLAVITGCSHPGILKILNFIGLEYKDNIDLLSGGLHLMNASKEEIAHITTVIDTIYKIKTIAPFHCTGKKAIKYFRRYMPQRLVKVYPGDYFSFNEKISSWELIKRGR